MGYISWREGGSLWGGGWCFEWWKITEKDMFTVFELKFAFLVSKMLNEKEQHTQHRPLCLV